MNPYEIANMLNRDEQIDMLRHLVNTLLPREETTYSQQKSGQVYPAVTEESVDYEVVTPRTFHDYFKLNLPSEEIAGLLGYSYKRQTLALTTTHAEPKTIDPSRITNLTERIQEGLQHVGMYSEMARREFLIAPLLLETIHYTDAQLYVEYSIKASDSLQGVLDYLLKTEHQLLVVEAKQGDLQRGFHQLMAELAALDLRQKTSVNQLYGIVSMGDGWQFGRLDRQNKMILQDTEHYSVPMNIELIIQIMIGILQGK